MCEERVRDGPASGTKGSKGRHRGELVPDPILTKCEDTLGTGPPRAKVVYVAFRIVRRERALEIVTLLSVETSST